MVYVNQQYWDTTETAEIAFEPYDGYLEGFSKNMMQHGEIPKKLVKLHPPKNELILNKLSWTHKFILFLGVLIEFLDLFRGAGREPRARGAGPEASSV